MTTMVKASGRLVACDVTIAAMATVTDGAGPEITVRVPPNAAAKKPTATEPYSPAAAPNPDATPKARANGNETTVAVSAPDRSPRSVCRS